MKRTFIVTVFTVSTLALLSLGALGDHFNLNAPLLPDASLTPGDALDVTAKDICQPGYAGRVRNVPQAVKEQAYKEYGITHRAKGEYEVDHLISLELGGSNSIKNLWPQSYQTKPWNAHVKDKLENALHEDVCAGKIDIKAAQRKIATNWIATYKAEFPNDPVSRNAVPKGKHGIFPLLGGFHLGKHPKTPDGTPVSGNTLPDAKSQVWVNTNSGVYWRPGTKYYGKTKHGKYMSETDAIKAGYHAVKGEQGKN
jgi:hypothetical protein